jgi:hypothetical protein
MVDADGESRGHCEERSDEAISVQDAAEIASLRFASLAMTGGTARDLAGLKWL